MNQKHEMHAPFELAMNLMDSLFELYAYAALNLGLDIENEADDQEASKEARQYAQTKFIEIVKEFESNFPGCEWKWDINPLTKD